MRIKRKRVKMPSATSIVARSYPDNIIGVENRLPWHLRTDLQLFKRRTSGHAIIMGRKTFESLGNRPLPNRTNIILSRSEILSNSPDIRWARDVETALLFADVSSIIAGKLEFFVIGGEQIYKIFERYINQVFLTEVFCGPINGDAKFETDFEKDAVGSKSEWKRGFEDEYPKSEHDQFPFRITRYERRKPEHRFKSKEEFMGREPDFDKYFELYEKKVVASDSEGVQFEFFPEDTRSTKS
ncbi:dihydrofolate reductase [Rhizobium aethiopicum]|uniref:dihydrofolate reductase n=1 Tax=Rhizobium aethiopicum TaxID=1138170 RepID=A0A7W6QDJ2_9HYPH|nr:dihydrofolate reductase [Rhizobium aethiopicum]MBB4195548.1 dihydrofolate reductase [Rhizobium aethiopicum]MBB4583256.1 dihydrofolate reductase [Rhizobium aethiopicum]